MSSSSLTATMTASVTERAGAWRSFALILGAVGTAFLAACAWHLGRQSGQFVLSEGELVVATVPTWLVFGAVAAILVAMAAFAASLRHDMRVRGAARWCFHWAREHPVFASLLGIAGLIGGVDIYELLFDPFNKVRGVRPWTLRQDLQTWMQLAAAVLAGVGISAWFPAQARFGQAMGRLRGSLRSHGALWCTVALGLPACLGGAMAYWALEGIPHFSDSLTYLMQGRMLWHGLLFVPAPMEVDLFKGSLFFVAADGRFFGKYPLGWPAIVGAFDRVQLGFAANAILTACAAALTGLVAREVASRRVAVLATVLFGLAPWIWFNGANFASHVSALCAVWGFLWLFVRTLRTASLGSALGAGGFLAIAVLIRPADAALFALPAIGIVLWRLVRRPQKWLLLGPAIAAAAMAGVCVYLWQNAQTTGAALTSPYALESRWQGDWDRSPLELVGRFFYQWVELNEFFPGWGIGGLTIAITGAVVAGARWRNTGLRLVAASSLLFFTVSIAFGFTTVWWGPRWLAPVSPMLAILAACFVDRMWTCARRSGGDRCAAAQVGMCIMIAGTIFGPVGVYAGQFYRHRLMPPHSVSSEAHRRVQALRIDQAVVAMPVSGPRAPLDARAGMVYMEVPFESNNVVYVRAIADWQEYARREFPGRIQFEVVEDTASHGGFRLRRVLDTTDSGAGEG